ncbi:hypothetical protein VN94_09850 [Corynebacterium diphtheriae]|nr:hypothetical protein VN94_09850 [Corynebacterium diphtheriae]
MPWVNGEFRPRRRNPDGIRCDDCNLTFAAGGVPPKDRNGERICSSCRQRRYDQIHRVGLFAPYP